MNATITAEQAYTTLAESIARPELRLHTGRTAGHQGDVYVHPITRRPSVWSVKVTEHRQVALGRSIGSRHCAEGAVGVFWPESAEGAARNCPIKMLWPLPVIAACIGPIVDASEPWTLTHPEHAHHRFPAGLYLITYQLDTRTLARVQD